MGFAFFAALAFAAVFVLDGVAAGIASLTAIVVFVGACIYALRDEDSEAVRHNQRSGLGGLWWF